MAFHSALLAFAVLLEVLTVPGPIFAADLAPLPEPASAVLLGIGVGAAGVAAWWKRRRKR